MDMNSQPSNVAVVIKGKELEHQCSQAGDIHVETLFTVTPYQGQDQNFSPMSCYSTLSTDSIGDHED
jgi:hypothetical protein